MIAPPGITRAVVFAGESSPVKSTQFAHIAGVAQEGREQFELLQLRVRHKPHKLIDRLTPAHLIIEPADLEHAPERAEIGRTGIRLAGIYKLSPFSQGISGKPLGHRLSFCTAATGFGGILAVHRPVEIYYRHSRSPEPLHGGTCLN